MIAIAVALVLGAQTIGCGGSSGTQPPPPPPPPQFTTIDAPGAGSAGTVAMDINANGDVTGYFTDTNGASHGFIRDSAGTVTAFDAPGAGTQGIGTNGYGINAAGTVVGTFSDQQDLEHGFIRASDGTFTTVDAPGSSTTQGFSINDSGEIAGTFSDPNGFHGFVRATDGTFTTFDTLTGAHSLGVARISESGSVVGSFVDMNNDIRGFLFTVGGGFEVLDAPGDIDGPGSGTRPFDINSGGTVAGVVESGLLGPQPSSHSFFVLDAAGNYTVFDPTEAGTQDSEARTINDGGTVVGDYLDANFVRHGYIRDPSGTFVAFDDPDAAQLRSSTINQGTVPSRINASGTIVGYFSDAAGTLHGFIRQ